MKKLLLLSLLAVCGLAQAEQKLPDVLPSFKGHCAEGYTLTTTVKSLRTNNATEFRCWSKGKDTSGCENTPMPDGTVYYSYEDILGNVKGYWKVPITKEFCVKENKKGGNKWTTQTNN